MTSKVTTTPVVVKGETKPGPRTTEFWVALATMLVQLINLVGIWDFVPNRISTIILGITAGAYALARGLAKQGQPYDPAAVSTRRLPF